ncbi:MAG: PEP-CTERM system TPR-repeat protein PrsT [Sutterellaceae bacterium]|nr:PEP-CTERM system TPR-repeat protein PrsT [Burkholderiaceae bacterium]MDW8429579.1 PEP-CTERM system TPR-repeat protein PrsT [Sutterellaceae bacterium]
MTRTRRDVFWLVATVLAAALAGCGKDSPEALIESAKAYAAKGDHAAAAIQLKNALVQRPEDGQARRLLGAALLETRDPASAEKELRRALELKESEAAVAPLLARSLYEQRAFDALLKEFGHRRFEAPEVEARVRTYVGDALLAKRRFEEAAAAFAAALQVDPHFTPAKLGAARLALIAGRLQEGQQLTREVIAVDPRNVEANLLAADLDLARGDRTAAKATLKAALKGDAADQPLHLALVSLALDEGALEEAAEYLDAARQQARGDLQITYFDALLALRRGKLDDAREHVMQLLKRAPEHVPSLVLAAAVELQAGRPNIAEDYLRRALARAPSHAGARRLLVAALLRSGQAGRALEALQPLLKQEGDTPPSLLMLAGETYLANGDLKQASAYFERAVKADAQTVMARTRLAQIAIARGEEALGLRGLEEAAALDPNQIQADVALVMNHLRRGDFGRAQKAARALVDKQPRNPLSHQILGAVLLAQKDYAAARASFERAIELTPSYLPAAISLAELDLAEKKPEDARRRFERLAARDPRNELILLAQAEFERRAGASQNDILALLEKAVSVNPSAVGARVALIEHHLRLKDVRRAVTAAQEAAAALPKEPRVLEVLARAHEAAGEVNSAADALSRLAALQPGSADALLRLAALQVRNGQPERAIDTLRRAQKVAPENRQVDRDLVALLLQQKRTEDALRHARELQSRAPTDVSGYVLEGDVYVGQKRFSDAERAYREALKIEANGVIATKLIAALAEGGKSKEADAFAARWLTEQPRDVAVRVYLADRALRQRQLKAAAAHYAKVIELEPNNVVALNNLAWIGGELGDPKALGYAERAVKLAPQSAPVLDTLGMLLVKRGQIESGLRYLEQARALAPARPDLQLNYARALLAAGRKEEARRELRALADAKEETAEKRAAGELLKAL